MNSFLALTALLAEPFGYAYMVNAMWVSALVGALCAFLSAFLMLKGWSLIGDALSHAIVPGIAGAYMLALPLALGAFISAALAAGAMLLVSHKTKIKTDAAIALMLAGFFALGLFMVSLNPVSVNISVIVDGNILAIPPGQRWQLVMISVTALTLLTLKQRDFMAAFFDEAHARSIGLRPGLLKVVFFCILAGSTVAAFQTVGAFLVVALVITPGAAAYLLTDDFPKLILLSVLTGALCCVVGVYLSYFLNGATGGVIIVLLTLVFLSAYVFAPKHGLIAAARLRRLAQ